VVSPVYINFQEIALRGYRQIPIRSINPRVQSKTGEPSNSNSSSDWNARILPICSQMIKFGQIILSRMVNNWLVVDQPLWKIWVRQLGWWHSQYLESHKIPWFQTTNQITMDRPIITINNLINNPERYILSLLAPENLLSVGYRDRTTTQHSREYPSLMEIQPTPKFSTKKEIVWPLSLLDVGAWWAPGSLDWRIGRTKRKEINGTRKEIYINIHKRHLIDLNESLTKDLPILVLHVDLPS
jgi:hypothetical protein